MIIYTTQMSKWRRCKELNIKLIDTTVKSGIAMFSPTWGMVNGYKNGHISSKEYTALYMEKLNDSYFRYDWSEFLSTDEPLALACYCASEGFCHRYLLKDYIERLCIGKNISFTYMGEIT